MKQGYRHRIIIQDRSYSMNEILAGAQEGLDEFIAGQAAEPGQVTFSIWDFDTEIRCVHSFESAEQVRGYQIRPRDNTNLYAAVALAVEAEGRKLAEMPEGERPEDVTVLVASDGQHNVTTSHTGPQAKAVLDHQQAKYGWRVLFMGCGDAAFAEGASIGASGGLTVNTVRSDAGQRNAWKMSNHYLLRAPVASAAGGQEISLTPEERALGESGEEEES